MRTTIFKFARAALVIIKLSGIKIDPSEGPGCWISRPLLALSLLLFISLASAQPYADNWFSVDGGGTSTGGVYSVSGTIGQPDGGLMSGGGYTLYGGFWGAVAALPPRLTTSYANGFLAVCWPFPSSGYVFEQSDTLATPVWTPVTLQPTQVDEITWCVVLQIEPGPRFYRLRKSP